MRPWESAGDRNGGYRCLKPVAVDTSATMVAGKPAPTGAATDVVKST